MRAEKPKIKALNGIDILWRVYFYTLSLNVISLG